MSKYKKYKIYCITNGIRGCIPKAGGIKSIILLRALKIRSGPLGSILDLDVFV